MSEHKNKFADFCRDCLHKDDDGGYCLDCYYGNKKATPTRTKIFDVKCPFFVSWRTTSVSCESFIKGASTVRINFPREYEMSNFVRKNCYCINPQCPIYKLLNEKYEK